MEVAADAGFVGEVFGDAAEELEADGEFDFVVAVDGGGDGVDHPLEDVGLLREVDDRAFVVLRDVHVLEFLVFEFEGVAVHVDVEHAGFVLAAALLFDPEDAGHGDVVAGGDVAGDVVFDVDVDVLGGFAAAEAFGGFLDAEFLGVDEGGLVVIYCEGALAFAALAFVGFLEAGGLGNIREGAAALAFEGGFLDFRADVGGFADDALDGDERVDVGGADFADRGDVGEVGDADVGLAEGDVDGEVVEPEGFFGVLAELIGLGEVIVGDIWVESVEVGPVDVERAVFGVVFGEVTDGVAIVVPVELFEAVDEFPFGGLGHSHQWFVRMGYELWHLTGKIPGGGGVRLEV